jgi:hypothetical protein
MRTKCCIKLLRSGSTKNDFQSIRNGGERENTENVIIINNLRVIQYNSNGLSGGRKNELIHLLDSEKPDVVLLQESCFVSGGQDVVIDMVDANPANRRERCVQDCFPVCLFTLWGGEK